MLAATIFLLSIAIPNFVGTPRNTKTGAIINNLRQLDAAMQQWGIENGETGAVAVTEQELAPYVRFSPVAGERYVVRVLSQPPEAHLTRRVERLPAGTVVRLNTNGGVDFRSSGAFGGP